MAARGPAATHKGFPSRAARFPPDRVESGPTRHISKDQHPAGPQLHRRYTVSATNINRVVLTGNLTRDPELRSTPGGTSVCSLRMASNTRRKDNTTGEWVDKPNYFSVTVWGAQGENCARFLSKGRPVCIDGRLEWREWQTQEGQKRESIEIVADAVQFIGGRDDLASSSEDEQREPVAAGAAADPD